MFTRINKQNILLVLTLLKHQNTNRNTRRIKQTSRQTNHRIHIIILQKLSANALLSTTPKQNTMRKNNRHSTILPQKVETMQQKSKVSRRLRRQTIILKPEILPQSLVRIPTQTKRRRSEERRVGKGVDVGGRGLTKQET